MIALQSLKYKIFEWCLDTLVDKLLVNFSQSYNTIITNPDGSIDVKNLRIGMKIPKIVAKISWDDVKDQDNTWCWTDCIITALNREGSNQNINWTFEKCNKNGVDQMEYYKNKEERVIYWYYDPDDVDVYFYL